MSKFARYASALTLLLAIPGFAADEKPEHPKKKGLVQEMSGQGYGMAGCGLGSILFGEQTGMVQVFASTTNQTYWNNTFGMSSGTSNCAPEEGQASAAVLFIEGNRQAVENDIARGKGESLATLAGLMGCKDSRSVGQHLQRNYSRVLPTSEVSNEQLLSNIKETLRANKQTANSCSQLS